VEVLGNCLQARDKQDGRLLRGERGKLIAVRGKCTLTCSNDNYFIQLFFKYIFLHFRIIGISVISQRAKDM
jgi:hypothetical protein